MDLNRNLLLKNSITWKILIFYNAAAAFYLAGCSVIYRHPKSTFDSFNNYLTEIMGKKIYLVKINIAF